MRYFFLILVIWGYSMGWYHVPLHDPSGIHFIRQTDGLAFASYYYHNGLDFFHPGTFNQEAVQGQVACEFPVFYYLTAWSYVLFGVHFSYLKIFHFLASLMGLIFLFKWLCKVWPNGYFGALGVAVMLSSVVMSYYLFNYLPDAPALAFALVGWSLGYQYVMRGQVGSVAFWWFFGLAGLIKPTFYIHGLAFLGSMFLLSGWNGWSFFKRNRRLLLYFSLSTVAILAWNLFAIHYNALSHDNYFLVSTRPFYSMDQESKEVIYDFVLNWWFRDYFGLWIWRLWGVLLLVMLVGWKSISALTKRAFIVLSLGTLAYLFLFFGQLRDHDYYALNAMPWFALVLVASGEVLSVWMSKWPPLNWITGTVIFLVVILAFTPVHHKLHSRWLEQDHYYAHVGQVLKDGKSWLDQASVPADASIATIPDRTRNGSLLFCDRPGWTVFDSTQCYKLNWPEVKERVDYLIVLDSNYLHLPEVQQFGKIKVFDSLNNRFLLVRF